MITDQDIERLEELAGKATPGPWEADLEQQGDSPDKHYEYAVFDGAGNRLFGTENRDASVGLIEIEYDDDGARVWNELSRRDMQYVIAANPSTIISLIERLREAEAEREHLQGILDSRPAINAALPDSYIRWSQAIYSGEFARAMLGGGS
ncbi:MAG: hypothetical protein ACRCTG_14535 [Aestuariivirga sp.]